MQESANGLYLPKRKVVILSSPPWGALRRTQASSTNDRTLTEKQVDSLANLASLNTPRATVWLVHMPWGLHDMWVRILRVHGWESLDNPLVFVRPGGWVKTQFQSDSLLREFRSNTEFLWIFKKKAHRATRTFEETRRHLGNQARGVMALTLNGHSLPRNKVIKHLMFLSAYTQHKTLRLGVRIGLGP